MTPARGPAAVARRAGELSGLWRALSHRNRFHLLVLGSSALAFAAVLLLQLRAGRSTSHATGVAVNAAAMLFLAWAVAREIDPDHSQSALLAAALGGFILLGGSAPAGASVALLAALRIVTRSTGKAPTGLDLVALTLLAGAIALTPRGWIGGVAVAAALAWDTGLPEGSPRRNYVGSLAALAATSAVTLLGDTLEVGFVMPDPLDWAAVAGGMLGFAFMRRYAPRSVQDRGKAKIRPERLRAGQRLAAGCGLGAFAVFGGAAVPLLAGLWGTLIGVALYDRLQTTKPADP